MIAGGRRVYFTLDLIEQAYDVFGAADEHDALNVVLSG